MSKCDPLALTTTVNTLAAALASTLTNEELTLTAAVLTQMGDIMNTIAAQRALCKSSTEKRSC